MGLTHNTSRPFIHCDFSHPFQLSSCFPPRILVDPPNHANRIPPTDVFALVPLRSFVLPGQAKIQCLATLFLTLTCREKGRR